MSDRAKVSVALVKECRVDLVAEGCSELGGASHFTWNVNHLSYSIAELPENHLTGPVIP